jgi:hypothetical protein
MSNLREIVAGTLTNHENGRRIGPLTIMQMPEKLKKYLREIASRGGQARARKGHNELSKIALRGAATRKANGNRRKATR